MRRGFTLVEMLVVVALIGILTVVTVAQFSTAQKKANDVQRKGDLSALDKALGMYFADYNVFPSATALAGGSLVVGGNTINWGGDFKDASGYEYMKVMPKEQHLTTPYCYKVDSLATPKKFALFAQLENTNDKDCGSPNHVYQCNGNTYCFTITSPNTGLNADGSFN